MKSVKVNYLRHGPVLTGGARHQIGMLDALQKALEVQGLWVEMETHYRPEMFHGFQNIELVKWGYRHADGDINVVPARLAISSILKNANKSAKTIIVIHKYDPHDGKSVMLERYFRLLWKVLDRASAKKVAIVCDSPHFTNHFKSQFPHLTVEFFPSLFDFDYYSRFRVTDKHGRLVIMGQWLDKNEPELPALAKEIGRIGYKPMFFTIYPEFVATTEDYEVKMVDFEQYLATMGQAYCSLALPHAKEGWPRMVHESFLVGTPVIGYARGGLDDLLREGDGYIVEDRKEVLELLKADAVRLRTPEDFYTHYDIATAQEWIKPVLKFCLG